jgi:hypothetical protein
MTQNQTEKLERLHNRATRYELVMRNDKSGETLRLRYAMRANGRSLRSAVSDLAKELVAFTGAEEVIFTAGDWQWIGPHLSQRMFGITQERAEAYAARHGGEAKPMQEAK